MSDLQNETEFQDDFYTLQQQYIDEELSFLTQAREQMRSYNEQFSVKGMEESFLQSITPPDPFEELYAPIEQDVPQTEEQAEPAPRRKQKNRKKKNRKKKDGTNRRSKNKLFKTALSAMERAKAFWQKQSRVVRIGAISALAVLLCLILMLIPLGAGETEPTIRRGVTIDGVKVSGMTRQEAIDALSRPLDEKLAGTQITLTYAGESWSFDSTALGLHHDLDHVVDRALSFDRPNRLVDWFTDALKKKRDARNLNTSIVVSEVILRTTLGQVCGITDENVVEGGVTFDPDAASESGLFTITAPRSGRTIDFTRLVADIRTAANAGGVHTIAVRENATSPKYTLSELKLSVSCIAQISMNITAYDDTQCANIASALSHVNGVCIESGKNFSFNTYAAPYSGENGYAMTQDDGGEYCAEGISVASTLVYRAGLLGNLKLLTRFAPKTPVEYSAAGLDAAVGAQQDLVFKNESEYPVYICTSIVDGNATVSIYGMPPEDSIRVRVETEILSYEETPAPTEVKNDGTHTLPEGAPLDLVPSTPACTVRTWRVYSDKFEREIYREQVGADSTYEQVVGIRIIP